MYDSLMYVKKLEAVGIPRTQAEAQVEIMSQIVDSNFATKHDMKDLRSDLRGEMQALTSDLRGEMQALRSEMQSEMQALSADLKLEIKDTTLLFGKMLAASAGIIIAAVALLLKL